MDSTQLSITEAVENVLAQSSIRELRQIRVDNQRDSIQLSGRVRSFYHKQLAQEAVKVVAAGMKVENHVDVCAN